MLNDCPLNGDDLKRLTESPSGFQKEPSANETDGSTTERRGASNTQESNSYDYSNVQTPSNLHISCNLHTSSDLHNSSNGELKAEERERLSKGTLNLKPRVNGIIEPGEDISKSSKSLNSIELSPYGEGSTHSRSTSPEINRTTTPINAETQRLPESYESLVTRPVVPPRRKYSSKSSKFVREPTPGLDLCNDVNSGMENLTLKSENNIVKKIVDEDQIHNGSTFESCNEMNGSKTSSEHLVEISNDDSGFESQTQVKKSNRPITEAVTEWLRKANSPDLFITTNLESDSDNETDEDEDIECKPPKNLQGNPMPALSLKGSANNESLSRLVSCSEFAKTNKRVGDEQKNLENTSAVPRRKRNSKNKKKKNAEKILRNEIKNSKKSSKQTTDKIADCNGNIRRISNSDEKSSTLVDGVCEFAEEDSVAGVRVASNSRMNEVKIVRVQGPEEKAEHPTTVRTFEKGEIVVSIEGKLLPLTKLNYEPVLCTGKVFEEEQTERVEKDIKSSIAKEIVNKKIDKLENRFKKTESQENNIKQSECEETEIEENEVEISLGSIEEPDVLECWEAETVEPVVSPRKVLRNESSFHEGEAAEEDDLNLRVEHVEKYYRIARESVTSCTSVEEELSDEKVNSRTVPNSPESLQSEEIPVYLSDKKQRIPIDEAFEVYESCYNGNQYITLDPRFRKHRSIYGPQEDGPIPCKAVCCNIQ